MICRLVAVAVLSAATAQAQPDDGKRVAIGVQFSPADSPRGHLGIPIDGTMDGTHLAAALIGRYQFKEDMAVNFGAGLPSASLGPAVWAGFEVFARLVADPRRLVAVELYENAGLELGFAGPDYYARRDNDFPGYGYAFGGDVTFALRLPVGVRFCWLENRFDTFVEGTSIIALTPAVETFFDFAVGGRVHF